MLTVHGRTRKNEQSAGGLGVDWSGAHLRDMHGTDTLVVGNGDVISYEHALQLAGNPT